MFLIALAVACDAPRVALPWDTTATDAGPWEQPDIGSVVEAPWRFPEPIESEQVPGPEGSGGTEQVPGADDYVDGAWLFRHDVVHEIALEIDQQSWNDLKRRPEEYTDALFEMDGIAMEVGIRLKGSSTFQDIDDDPSFKVKFDWSVPGQRFMDLQGINLHANLYDPTDMHEYLAYRVYREAGLPAPRTGFAHLTVNGQDYGVHHIVERKDETFLAQFYEDNTGSIYEAGSDNWGCDVNDHDFGGWCSCWELDQDGDGDTREDLADFCAAVTNAPDDQWLSVVEQRMNWEEFLGSMAVDALIAHWDSYGYNLNNYHLHHVPSEDRWGFSPWSTDLAFGWNPWDWQPDCGEYGTEMNRYNRGYILSRCFELPECLEQLRAREAELAAFIGELGVREWIDDAAALLAPYAATDPTSNYDMAEFWEETACIADFLESRVESIAGGP